MSNKNKLMFFALSGMALGVFLFVGGGLMAGRPLSLIIGAADFILGALFLWMVYNES